MKQQDDLALASHCQLVDKNSIMAAISVVLKFSLDNVNEPSRHCRSSNSRALISESAREATAYLLIYYVEQIPS